MALAAAIRVNPLCCWPAGGVTIENQMRVMHFRAAWCHVTAIECNSAVLARLNLGCAQMQIWPYNGAGSSSSSGAGSRCSGLFSAHVRLQDTRWSVVRFTVGEQKKRGPAQAAERCSFKELSEPLGGQVAAQLQVHKGWREISVQGQGATASSACTGLWRT